MLEVGIRINFYFYFLVLFELKADLYLFKFLTKGLTALTPEMDYNTSHS
jgi:hypothetical protein